MTVPQCYTVVLQCCRPTAGRTSSPTNRRCGPPLQVMMSFTENAKRLGSHQTTALSKATSTGMRAPVQCYSLGLRTPLPVVLLNEISKVSAGASMSIRTDCHDGTVALAAAVHAVGAHIDNQSHPRRGAPDPPWLWSILRAVPVENRCCCNSNSSGVPAAQPGGRSQSEFL